MPPSSRHDSPDRPGPLAPLKTLVTWALRLSLLGLLIVRAVQPSPDIPLLLLVAFAFVMTMVPVFIEGHVGRALPFEIDLLATVSIYLDVFLGEGLRWYDSVFAFDWLTHFMGSLVIGLIALMFGHTLNHIRRIRLSTGLLALVVFTTSMTIGTLFEIAEFALDKIWGYNTQRSLDNTMWDIVFNTVGALVAAVGGALHFKYMGRLHARMAAVPLARLFQSGPPRK